MEHFHLINHFISIPFELRKLFLIYIKKSCTTLNKQSKMKKKKV